jgi:hypothetical protein
MAIAREEKSIELKDTMIDSFWVEECCQDPLNPAMEVILSFIISVPSLLFVRNPQAVQCNVPFIPFTHWESVVLNLFN